MDTTTNTSTSKILRTADWYESGLMLWWGDIERVRALILDLIHTSTSNTTEADTNQVVTKARLLLQELGQK